MLHPVVEQVTEDLRRRSRESRQRYLARLDAARREGPYRARLSCGNLAHGFAACGNPEKQDMAASAKPNVAIVSAYNDMLSAHQPFESFPDRIRHAVREAGGLAQFAGGTPAMCDGVTQGRSGMELSLFSRDVIALSTAIALSHDMFDAALYLGVCDKIVPGLLIGALSFGHLPAVFVPAGPMTSGLSNAEKARVRQRFAEGKADRAELLQAESAAYHGPGTCTFYGTANSNQMLMEVMGLHLPGASFVSPNTPLRDALTDAAARQVLRYTATGPDYRPVGWLVDERAIINGVVGLLATGGSTNHTLHLPAIAHAAGIDLRWEDFDALSAVVPLITRIYPNGSADINHFHAAGGMAVLIAELLDAGLLHPDIVTVADQGMADYRREPALRDGRLSWHDAASGSHDRDVLRSVGDPFSPSGGLRLIQGNLGRGVIKLSAVAPEHRQVEAPAIVFDSQAALEEAFRAGQLDRDFVAVLPYQGPRACGMPELHKLTPILAVLQDRGHKVGLVTDGRMSGASGKVPAAIHLCPEAAMGGALARVRSGDRIRLSGDSGQLDVLVDRAAWDARVPAAPFVETGFGLGRELFRMFRAQVGPADRGARCLGGLGDSGMEEN